MNNQENVILGYTLFFPNGYKTYYKSFSSIEHAKAFVSSHANIKNNYMIYVDIALYNTKIEVIQKLKESRRRLYEIIDEMSENTIYKEEIKQYENEIYNSYDYDIGIPKDLIYLLEDEKVISRKEEKENDSKKYSN